jgi:UDP-N-acetylmuramate dehydrogenase
VHPREAYHSRREIGAPNHISIQLKGKIYFKTPVSSPNSYDNLRKKNISKKNNSCWCGWNRFPFYYEKIDDFTPAFKFIRDNQLPWYLLGAGTNVVIDDSYFNGVVLVLGGEMKKYTIDSQSGIVSAGAGAPLMPLGFNLLKKGYCDFLYMGLIPGTVGGAVCMNAGTTHEGEVKNQFIKAQIFDPEFLCFKEWHKDDMKFGNRSSRILRSNNIVVNAQFKLNDISNASIDVSLKKYREAMAKRRKKQPKNPKNFGSTFKNPEGGKTAGWYLEQVGMKGEKYGGAMMATEHANWIINTGGATSSDIKALIDLGKKRVFESFGIRLEREVIYLPEDII